MSKIGIQTRGSGAVMRTYLRGGGIAKRGTGQALKSGGRIGKFGGGRTNLLEQLGRVEAEPSNPNRRAEISRVHGELNRGYKTGGRVGKLAGGVIKKVIQGGKKISKKISDAARKQDTADSMKRFEHAGPHEGEVITKRILGKRTKKGDRTKAAVKDAMVAKPWAGKPHAEGGRIGLKHGGKPWGTGPKPGTHEFMMQDIHKKRKGKAVGGTLAAVRRAAKTFIEQVGGREEGKPHSTKEGRIASGKRKIRRFLQSRSRPKKTWPPKHSDLLRKFPKMPQPHKSPGDLPYIPMPKHDPNKPREYTPAATGGRMGLKKGGSDKNWIQKAVNPKHKGFCTPMTKKTCTPRRKALARTFKKMGRERKAKG